MAEVIQSEEAAPDVVTEEVVDDKGAEFESKVDGMNSLEEMFEDLTGKAPEPDEDQDEAAGDDKDADLAGDESDDKSGDSESEVATEEDEDANDKASETSATETKEIQAIPDYGLIARAVNAGMSSDLVDTLAKSGNLDATVLEFEKRVVSDSTDTPGDQDSVEDKKPIEKLEIELDPDLNDPEVIDAFAKMTEFANGLVDKLNGMEADAESSNSQASAAKVVEAFDSAIGGLEGEHWKELLGDGGFESLNQGGDAYTNRIDLMEDMAVSDQVRISMNRDPLSFKDQFQRSLGNVFPSDIKKTVTKEISDKVTERSDQIIERPTNRSMKTEEPGDEKALAYVKEFNEKHGIE